MEQLVDTGTNKYAWTEHVIPKEEDHKIAEESIEELNIQQPKKISLEEAEYKKALMQFGSEKKHAIQNINVTDIAEVVISNSLLEESKNTSLLLIKIMTELHNNELNIIIDHDENDRIEEQATNKLAKIDLLAQKQGQYLTNVYKTFSKELERLVSYYKKEMIKVTKALELEQKTSAVFEKTCKEQVCCRIMMFQIMNRKKNYSKH